MRNGLYLFLRCEWMSYIKRYKPQKKDNDSRRYPSKILLKKNVYRNTLQNYENFLNYARFFLRISIFCSNFAAGMKKNHIIGWLLAAVLLSACAAPKAPEEALRTVTEADSVWLSGGVYTDSVSLAQAYADLGLQSKRYPDAYVHACYHYGRLLRTKDDPVGAMQAFINATHCSTTDYHILGRVYSNIGSMCHLAEEFQLSYEMYEHSSDMFLRNGDTLNYYYALNDMAIELAEQKDSINTIILLDSIRSYSYSPLQQKTLETEVILNQGLLHHENVIILIDSLLNTDYKDVLGYVMKARAYYFLNAIDSAEYYAHQALLIAPNDNASIAAYYILTHDNTLSTDSLLELSSLRADLQKAWAYSHAKFAQAAQLIEIDLQQKPHKKQFYPIIIVLGASMIVVILVVRNRIRKRKMLNQITTINKKHVEEIVESIKKHIDVNDLNNTLHWKNYASMKSDADLYMGGIVSKLEAKGLSETEIRFCILTVLDFSLKRIADTIHYSYPSGIKTLKKRTSDKLKTTPTELKSFLLHKM